MFGENLDSDRAVQTRIGSRIHLSHAATTYGGGDFIWTEVCTGLDGHG